MAQAFAGEGHDSIRHCWCDQRRRHLTDPSRMIVGQNVRSLTSEDCKLGFDISRQFTAVGSEL
ncbi:MAG TPA: hypothetical protein VK567_10840, partial [Bradyrhizobium sp.]|nr:hypothetical protein [Bradyrhizobium sp.]